MRLGEAREYMRTSLSESARQAYAAYCSAYDTIGELANAMAVIEEQWSVLPKRQRPRINVEQATAQLYEAFFSLDEARETVDGALAILTGDGVELPRFPERA